MSLDDKTGKKQDTRFKPGQSGNPSGRPKGSRNKFTEAFFQLLSADYDEHGRNVLEQVRQKHPLQYLRLIVSVLPKRRETKAATPPADRLTNDELKQFVRETKRLLAKAETDTDEGETQL
jgi:Family of unknown function (DUF5681)